MKINRVHLVIDCVSMPTDKLATPSLYGGGSAKVQNVCGSFWTPGPIHQGHIVLCLSVCMSVSTLWCLAYNFLISTKWSVHIWCEVSLGQVCSDDLDHLVTLTPVGFAKGMMFHKKYLVYYCNKNNLGLWFDGIHVAVRHLTLKKLKKKLEK